MIKKVKNAVPWTYVISDLNSEETVWKVSLKSFVKNKLKRVYSWKGNTNEKTVNYILHGKVTIILLTVGLIKRKKYKWVNILKNWNP